MLLSAETYLRPRGRFRTVLLCCVSGESGQSKKEAKKMPVRGLRARDPLKRFGRTGDRCMASISYTFGFVSTSLFLFAGVGSMIGLVS